MSNDATPDVVARELAVPWWRSFVFRFVAVFAVGAVGIVVVSIWLLHERDRGEVEARFGDMLQAIAASTAPCVEGDDLAAIRGNADVGTPEWQRQRAELARVAHSNGLREDQIYILRPIAGTARLEFVVMLQERTFVGDPYAPPASLRAAYERVERTHRATRTPLYTDQNGTFISGLAPIFDSHGSFVAILQVDRGLDAYLADVAQRTEELTFASTIILVLIVALGVITHGRLRRKTLAVLYGTRAIQLEDYDFRVSIHGQDELAAVGVALNAAIARLKERFEMLKFLPSHTARMIKEASSRRGGVGLADARLVDVVVLESDIRGFSSISEKLQPAEVIGMLNLYIRAQAELVEAAGGSIDKFMGDAVLAIFEGPLKEARALSCAVEIQRAVAAMNLAGTFQVPIHVGVGISVGEVVMGNMGSEKRMEHTVIGATVNLAARLCSAAAKDEIVAQRAVLDAAGKVAGIGGRTEEEVRVKGFAEPVACVRMRVEG